MSKCKAMHTPGPWWTDAKYDGREMGCSIIAANTGCGPLPGNPSRGQVAFATAILNIQARQCEANARLIASAPDLLKSLVECVNYIGSSLRMSCDEDEATRRAGIIERARSAISKATVG